MFPDAAQNLLVRGKTPALAAVGIQYPPIDCHLEDAAVPLSQLRRDAKRLLDIGRQTCGRGEKASFDTIGDLDPGGLSP